MNKCHSTINITSGYPCTIGGLVGHGIEYEISESYAEGSISATGNRSGCSIGIGGIVGFAQKGANDELKDVYSNVQLTVDGKITTAGVGGILGYDANVNNLTNQPYKIENAYSIGRITTTDSSVYKGGIVGKNEESGATVTNSYWSSELTGVSTSAGGTSSTQAQMKTQANYQNWDFEDIWGIDEGTSYPYFLYENRGVIYNKVGEGTTGGETGGSEGTIVARSVRIIKYKTGTTTPLAGAVIGLCDQNGNLLRTSTTNQEIVLTTDSNGQVDFANIANLIPGTYYFKEVTPPTGYMLNSTIYSFTVDNSGNVIFTNGSIIYNSRIVATAGTDSTKIVKYKTNTEIPIQGTKIGLYDTSKNLIETLITGSDGKVDVAASGKLEIGTTYYYKEIEAAAGYKISDTNYRRIVVDNNGGVSFPDGRIMYNDRIVAISGSVVVYKYIYDSTTPLAGAVIGLCNANGDLLLTDTNQNVLLTTDKNGKVDFTSAVNIEPGTYYFKEVTPPTGYTLNNTIYAFAVDNTGHVTFANGNKIYDRIASTGGTGTVVTNPVAKSAPITIYKPGSTSGLPGAKIGVYDGTGTTIKDGSGNPAVATTGNDGVADLAKVAELKPGTYGYKIVSVPNGYKIDDSMHPLIIGDDGIASFDGQPKAVIYAEADSNLVARDGVAGTTTTTEKDATELPKTGPNYPILIIIPTLFTLATISLVVYYKKY